MNKKMFDNTKVRTTVVKQDEALEDRFKKADSVMLKPTEAPKMRHANTSVVRDTFSMPPDDYLRIEELRIAAGKHGRLSTSKSEVIRAGLQTLSSLNAQQLVDALNRLTKVRPGRKK